MDKILRPHQMYAAAYPDDVVVHCPDWETHLPRVQAVINSIREAGLTANPVKCSIGLEEAKYLGYNVGRGIVKPQKPSWFRYVEYVNRNNIGVHVQATMKQNEEPSNPSRSLVATFLKHPVECFPIAFVYTFLLLNWNHF